MSKAVLVMHMPECCAECDISRTVNVSGRDLVACTVGVFKFMKMEKAMKEKPDWCPLRELPEKWEVCGKYPQPGKPVPSYRFGWNACLDAITGEKNETSKDKECFYNMSCSDCPLEDTEECNGESDG